ncbi:hypothetical protein AB0C34_18715 [Nocardia sp. NPDC049220]|uniref:hypothetical protein n=1 Tax=Nocardia sp. NPDC049220 TaxID=3155273 RepID=UPI003400DB1C
MAADDIEAYTEKLRIAGSDTSQADVDLLGIVTGAERAATQASIAAGSDKYGSKFRDGSEGFDDAMASINDGTRNIATSFRRMSQGQYQAADGMHAAEQAAAESFGRRG